MLSLWLASIAVAVGDGWSKQDSGLDSRLRGLCAVDADVAWASGSDGTVLRTDDGGKHWHACGPRGVSKLDFRDIHARDESTAWVLATGPGMASRIFKTTNAGGGWALVHTNSDPRGFLDALAFWDDENGIVLGDPVDGRFPILITDDGGKTWAARKDLEIPPALPNEGAFAASGTCLVVGTQGHAWFATGGAERARVFRTTDGGHTWKVHDTPLRAGGPARGIFSLAFRDDVHGVAVGGDYENPDNHESAVAVTDNGGMTWRPSQGLRGYRSGVAYVPGTEETFVTVGPTGSEISRDGGRNWQALDDSSFDAVSFRNGGGWASGEKGSVAAHQRGELKR